MGLRRDLTHRKHGVSAQQMLAILLVLYHNSSSVAQKFQKIFNKLWNVGAEFSHL